MDTGDTGEGSCGLLKTGRLWLKVGDTSRLRGCEVPLGFVFSIPYEEPVMDPALEPAAAAFTAPLKPEQKESAPAPQPSGNLETVEAPAPTVDNLADLAQKVDNPVLVVILALIAVLSVGIWKHLGKLADQKNAVELKKLEIEQMSVKKGQTLTSQPPPCQAANTALEAKIATLEARLGKVESTSLALPAGFDAEELDERVRKLELARLKKGEA